MGEHIVKLRGLPWNTTKQEIYTFLKDCNIVNEEKGIHLTIDKDGRPSGECFVELLSHSDVEKAKAHDKENMGKRYIEVLDAKRAELEWFVNHMPGGAGGMGGMGFSGEDVFARLRGLPFEATKHEIAQFFSGIEIAPYGITITMDQDGRPSGEAYVEFASSEDREKALEKNKEKIGRRYIEIFKCSKHNVKYVAQSNQFGGMFGGQPIGFRPGPYDRPGMGFSNRGGGRGGGMMGVGLMSQGGGGGGGNFNGVRGGGGRGNHGPMRGGKKGNDKEMKDCKTGHMVVMRGLPYEAKQGDVYRFLAPIVPAEVRMMMDEENNRPKGTCEVDFNCHSDAIAAMSKDKQCMGHRYIEMFLKSEPGHNDGWGNNSMMNNRMNNSWQLWW